MLKIFHQLSSCRWTTLVPAFAPLTLGLVVFSSAVQPANAELVINNGGLYIRVGKQQPRPYVYPSAYPSPVPVYPARSSFPSGLTNYNYYPPSYNYYPPNSNYYPSYPVSRPVTGPIINSTLIQPTVINSPVSDSVLINPVFVNSSPYPRTYIQRTRVIRR